MSDSREGSPDWLRSFQAPIRSILTISSDSDVSNDSPIRNEEVHHVESIGHSPESIENQDKVLNENGEESPVSKAKDPKILKTGKHVKNQNPNKDIGDAFEGKVVEKDALEKPIEPRVSSRLPLVFPEKVQRSKALIECDGDSIDLSGDVGAVGRVVISTAPTGNHEMLLDLKGTLYKSTIVPSRTFCVVSIGQTEAKIEAIMNDFVQLKPNSNLFEAETMIEGTLDGFSFDSEDEGDKLPKPFIHQSGKSIENGDQANAKTSGKVEKGVMRKKAKTAVKPIKKGPRRPHVVKKTKNSKK